MKKRLNGFTLVEVLVCVGIVGMIAALVVPRFVNNTRGSINGKAIARGVELVQNGIANIMQEVQNNSDDEIAPANLSSITLGDLSGGDDDEHYLTDNTNLFTSSRVFMDIEDAANYNINAIRDYEGNALPNGYLTETHAYKFKKATPVVIFQEIQPAQEETLANAENDDILTRIYIDANGSDRPNRVGKDIFLFGLNNSGILIPAGSAAYFEFDNQVETDDCDVDEETDVVDPGNGLACTQRLVNNKWNIDF